MISAFWTNTIWYVILGIVSLVETVFAIVRAKNRKHAFGLYLTVLGITLHYELLILIFLKGYSYYPMIIRNSPTPFDDVLAGNLFSQFAIAATVILATVLNLKWYWYILLAAAYGAVEELFLSLGIYSHSWYQTWMTIVILPFAFWLAKKMYAAVTTGLKPVLYYGFIYLGLFPLHIITIIWGLMLSGHLEFNRSLLSDPISSRHLGVMILFYLILVPMMLMHFLPMKKLIKALIIVALYLALFYLYGRNLIWIKEGWFLLVSTITMVWMYLSIVLMDKLYGGPAKAR